jgi:hypothetical protein
MPVRSSISQRVRQGIARARAEGKAIGHHGRHLAAQARAEALVRSEGMRHVVEEFRATGMSYRPMVALLNARGEPTPSRTGRWHVKTLQRLVERVLQGPIELTRANVSRAVTRKSAGVYAAGSLVRGRLRVEHVGRSGDDLARRLVQLVSSYDYVAWTYAPSGLVSYQMECAMFHAWHPGDDTVHPARPRRSGWKCLVCSQ